MSLHFPHGKRVAAGEHSVRPLSSLERNRQLVKRNVFYTISTLPLLNNLYFVVYVNLEASFRYGFMEFNPASHSFRHSLP